MFQTKVIEKIKTRILFSVIFFSKIVFQNRAVCEKMWKKFVERGRPHDKMAHAHSMLDT